MFPEFPIDSITNGVHAPTWVSEPIQQMLDEHISLWRRDNLYLRNAIDLPESEILAAHARAKEVLLAEVATRTGLVLDPKVLTLGFARRVATYKRATLLFTDPERLVEIANQAGGLQIIYAGKAHPQDEPGQGADPEGGGRCAKVLGTLLKIVYLENYAGTWARCSRRAWMCG
jgi:starch phosphorylase